MIRLSIFFIAGFMALVSPMSGKRLHDYAGVLPQETAQRLEAELQNIERDTTAEVAVVTVLSLDGKSVDDYANELFNSWLIGKKDLNNGILFLIAPSERRTRIEVGHGLEGLISDELAGEILDTEVIPWFKSGEYDKGIEAGATTLVQILRTHPESARGTPGSTPGYIFTPHRAAKTWGIFGTALAITTLFVAWMAARRKSYPPALLFLTIAALLTCVGLVLYSIRNMPMEGMPLATTGASLGAAFVAVLSNLKRFWRYRPHYCHTCSTQLALLDDIKEDDKLTKEELLEEKLGSIDYDVWCCPACLKERTKSYKAFVSGFSACPKCNRRTYSEKSTVVRPASRSSTGSRRVDGECQNCWHRATRIEVIPRITSSSSGSSSGGGGGGGGGGRSGGGGASRSW